MVVNNPNNWHWVDKNCIDWTRTYFKEKLDNYTVENDQFKAIISKVSSVEGDVEVCQRKGKVISLFDLRLVLNFTGEIKSEGSTIEGSITIPELAYDSEESDLQFVVSSYKENSDSDKVIAFIKSKLLPPLRPLLIQFGIDLIKVHGSEIQLSEDKVNSSYTKANQAASNPSSSNHVNVSNVVVSKSTPTTTKVATTTTSSSTVPKYNTSTLHLEPIFNTTANQIYITLLDANRIAAWSRAPPLIESFPPKIDSEFRLFGGAVSGKILKLIPDEKIVQSWRLEDWKDGHYANLDIQLIEGAGETKMVVKFSGIPIGEEDRVRGNFEDYYIRSIKVTFGFGAVL
ncbi:activator of Hsp90 ATPase [Scheffersomyces coipomensis]|uniref:activator of Hsp90 ATPase n=1 Tax=Scheffersomyces coipomensis TaxID=1788519 RepID=UPI00315C6E08